jgi:hypothetical protein
VPLTNRLSELDEELQRIGAPIVGSWLPGLDDPEIDALLRPLDIELPEEAREWWRWHNGVRSDAPPISWSLWHRVPQTLQSTADLYAYERDDLKHLHGVEKLLAPLTGRPWVFFDCRGPRDAPVPILTQLDVTDIHRVLPSIESLVAEWIGLLRAGAWSIAADGTWTTNEERIPDRLTDIGIV